MGRTIVKSLRVYTIISEMFPHRKVKSILTRGNYPQRTYLVVFTDNEKGEMVTIPPINKKRSTYGKTR